MLYVKFYIRLSGGLYVKVQHRLCFRGIVIDHMRRGIYRLRHRNVFSIFGNNLKLTGKTLHCLRPPVYCRGKTPLSLP